MNNTKALEVAAEYRAEGKKLLALADGIEAVVRGTDPGASPPANGKEFTRHVTRTRKKGNAGSYLSFGIEVLRESGHAMHVDEMLPKIGEKMGKQVSRPNVEGGLHRGVKQGKLKRPRPSTYAIA